MVESNKKSKKVAKKLPKETEDRIREIVQEEIRKWEEFVHSPLPTIPYEDS